MWIKMTTAEHTEPEGTPLLWQIIFAKVARATRFMPSETSYHFTALYHNFPRVILR